MELTEIIAERIKTEGPISFRDYMEMALYYPECGYYTSVKEKIGERGDFYTGPVLTPGFGAMIARQIEQMWHFLGQQPFTIVEYGAGTGDLCNDILKYLETNEELYLHLRYCIVERSPAMREREKAKLKEKVSWHNSVEDISGFSGCVLSNELIDNFPVHKVVMEDDLMEVYVDYNNDFTEILRPATEILKNYLREMEVCLPKGFCTEINLAAIDWMKTIASSMEKGYNITIDYGHLSSRLYHECRKHGTLICYNKHRISDNPYYDIGNQDITSHVNFSALAYWGEKNGLEFCGMTSQTGFLVSLGFSDYLKETLAAEENIARAAMKAAFLNHTLLVDMGSKFKVFIQSKGLSSKDLNGLRGIKISDVI